LNYVGFEAVIFGLFDNFIVNFVDVRFRLRKCFQIFSFASAFVHIQTEFCGGRGCRRFRK
jgi:hypothetical protein